MTGKLARVHFTPEEEQTIVSMARWMRFMAVVGIVGGMLILFFLVLGIGVWSAAQTLGSSSPAWTKVDQFFDGAGPSLYLLAAIFLLAAIVTLWQNYALYHSGDFFNLVARTDIADVDYLARGLDKLRTFFKIQVLTAVVTVAVAVGTAVAFLSLANVSL